MTEKLNPPAVGLECGARVQLHDATLQAFYGSSGTVVKICRCPRDGHVTRVDVQMDDLVASEDPASFYAHEVHVIVQADSSGIARS